MRRLALVFAVFTSAQSLSVDAQDTLRPTFRAGTTLIEFTIVVRDSQGNPVTDLTKDDISITRRCESDRRDERRITYQACSPDAARTRGGR